MKYLYRALPAIVVAAILVAVPWLHSSRTMPHSQPTERFESFSASLRKTMSTEHLATAADRAALAVRVEAQAEAVLRAGWAPVITIEAQPAPEKRSK